MWRDTNKRDLMHLIKIFMRNSIEFLIERSLETKKQEQEASKKD